MRKKIKKIITFCTTFILSLGLTLPVHAEYDGSKYEHVDDTWYVTDYHGSPCNVILYTLIQDRYAFPGTGHSFSFSCNEAEFSTGATMATMEYFYYSDRPFEITDFGKIYYGDFGIEPGNYTFAGGSGNVVLSFDTSISAIDLPNPEAYSRYESANTVTVQEGDSLIIFALAGDKDWRKEVYNDFYNWSIQKRDKHENYFKSTVLLDEEPEEILEPYYEKQDDGTHLYCTYDEKKQLVKLQETCTYNTNVCIYCDGLRPVEEIEIVPNVIDDTKGKNNSISTYLSLIASGLVLVVLFIIAKIRTR